MSTRNLDLLSSIFHTLNAFSRKVHSCLVDLSWLVTGINLNEGAAVLLFY